MSDGGATIHKGTRSAAPDDDEPGFLLLVVDGVDRDKSFEIASPTAGRVLIGTSAACDVRLTDPHVSRRHAAVEIDDDRLRLTDLDSSNGTRVGGLGIVEVFLAGGEVVEIGSTTISVARRPVGGGVRVPNQTSFGRMIGASVEMRRLYPLCAKLAKNLVPVVIEGETGTGKEVLAESLHDAGPRASAPFVVFDCTTVAPSLVESELFGHERGAFTGANATRIGVFEQAHGGTLFIDEIGDLDPLLQPKLLRAIERSEIRRVGGQKTIRVDVRVIVATRRDLDKEVASGRFRDDLFHRLNVARIELPPLRRRRGDVTILARHFAHEFAAGTELPHRILSRWESEQWSGNVRELRNAVARYIALDEGAEAEDVTPDAADDDVIASVLARGLPLPIARQLVVTEFERRYVEAAIAQHGSAARAAEASGIAKRHLHRLRARHRG